MLHSALLLLLLSPPSLPCQEQEPAPEAQAPVPEPAGQDVPQLDPPLEFRTGTIRILADKVEVVIPEGWTWLDRFHARRVVEGLWGNPPDTNLQGMFLPGSDPDSWGVLVYWDGSGHVNDDDAASIDFAELLQTMKDGTREANKERKKAGYGTVDLLRWAEPPHYDSRTKKLYWARVLQFEGQEDLTLNYEVRVLGRKGSLELTAVSSVDELPVVSEGCKMLLAATSFTEGNRYQDFDSSIDKVAAYGIGGLIAGKVLLKAGLLKVLLKPILIGLAVLGALFAKVFRRGKAAPPAGA
ncbi:MAG: DUF2167 domain-containing protein [Planctomycetota bacterium]